MHGPIDRQSDIARTAQALLNAKRIQAFSTDTKEGEIRARYLQKWTDPGLPEVVQTLNTAALAPDITTDEFHKMYILSRFGGGTAKDILASKKELAALMYIDDRRWKRVRNKLEEKGWLSVKTTTLADGGPGFNRFSLENPVVALLRKIDAWVGVSETPRGGGLRNPEGGGLAWSKVGVCGTPQYGIMEKKEGKRSRSETRASPLRAADPPEEKHEHGIIRTPGGFKLAKGLSARVRRACGKYADRLPAALALLQKPSLTLPAKEIRVGVLQVACQIGGDTRAPDAVRRAFPEILA